MSYRAAIRSYATRIRNSGVGRMSWGHVGISREVAEMPRRLVERYKTERKDLQNARKDFQGARKELKDALMNSQGARKDFEDARKDSQDARKETSRAPLRTPATPVQSSGVVSISGPLACTPLALPRMHRTPVRRQRAPLTHS